VAAPSGVRLSESYQHERVERGVSFTHAPRARRKAYSAGSAMIDPTPGTTTNPDARKSLPVPSTANLQDRGPLVAVAIATASSAGATISLHDATMFPCLSSASISTNPDFLPTFMM
jgi:hypothetical protein